MAVSQLERTRRDGYYTDGADLFEVTGVGAGLAGPILVRNSSTLHETGIHASEFRRLLWLVRDSTQERR